MSSRKGAPQYPKHDRNDDPGLPRVERRVVRLGDPLINKHFNTRIRFLYFREVAADDRRQIDEIVELKRGSQR